jgi:hypothetical protein
MKYTEKNIWSSKRKWCADNPQHSRVDESVQKTSDYLSNQKRKIKGIGHVERMSGERTVKKMFKNTPE